MTMQAAEAACKESDLYINRDLSWLEFNWRVLEEAEDERNPLLERIKFLAIVSSNLDEFMAVRVAGIKDQLKAGYGKRDFSGWTPSELLKRIIRRTSRMVGRQYAIYRELHRLLGKEGIVIADVPELDAAQRQTMEDYFHSIIYPVLTPMAVDQGRPFPLLHSLGLYLAIVLQANGGGDHGEHGVQEVRDGHGHRFAIVKVPSILPRLIAAPQRGTSNKQEYVLIEQLIRQYIHTLFPGYSPVSVHAFRLTRNADLTLDEEGAEDLLREIEKELRKRQRGLPVRMEVERDIHPFALEMLQEKLELPDQTSVFEIDGPLDLTFLSKLADAAPGSDHLRHEPIEPVYPAELEQADDLFEVLRQRDVLVYHPYESFDAVDDFIEQAATDPHVLAIKMTLYRVSGNSAIVRNLARAAGAGKQVTVMVELRARFDEERNIAWARKLEQAGCHVVYGLVGLKTHAKVTLVVRREGHSLRRYVHIGTGNYNGSTAKLYTDVGLFTSDPDFGEDATALFNEVTGYSITPSWKAFAVAPHHLKSRLFQLIEREMRHAREGKPARIIAKMNSLSNREMVDKLYEASRAGVKIDLIVRGICCLRPGVEGVSEHIRVISIVDRFLEHSRIYSFANGGDEEIYISSADWMTRNLHRRIELMCPVRDRAARQSLSNMLQLSLGDNVKARELLSTGQYRRVAEDGPPLRSQFASIDVSSWKRLSPP